MKVISTEAITKLIQIIKDSFIHRGNSEIVNEVTLADVAISGSYNDLTNKLIAGTNITIQNGIISATSGGSLPISQIISLNCSPSYVPEGCLPCDGAEYLKAQFYSFWINYIETNYLNTCTYEEYESEIATYGQCAKFAVDTANFKFKVPTINKIIADVADTLGVRGNGTTIGLTTGEKNYGLFNSTQFALGMSEGYYGTEQNTSASTYIGTSRTLGLAKEASNSGIVADVDKTYLELRYFVVVANGSINQSMMDWSNWASSLQGKTNIDLSNVTQSSGLRRLIEVSDSSLMPSWYKVFEETNPQTGEVRKWCEQGGECAKSVSSVTLIKEYIDTNYLALGTALANDSYPGCNIYNKTTTGFSMFARTNPAKSWEAKGYIN